MLDPIPARHQTTQTHNPSGAALQTMTLAPASRGQLIFPRISFVQALFDHGVEPGNGVVDVDEAIV